MAQKYYVASKGSWYLSLTTHPGNLSEEDIVSNLERMMTLDVQNQGDEVNKSNIRKAAMWFYQEEIERLLEMVKPQTPLQEVEPGAVEEILNLSFSEWELWEFPRTEWD